MPPLRFWLLLGALSLVVIGLEHVGPPDRSPEGSRYYGRRREVLGLMWTMVVCSVGGAILTLFLG